MYLAVRFDQHRSAEKEEMEDDDPTMAAALVPPEQLGPEPHKPAAQAAPEGSVAAATAVADSKWMSAACPRRRRNPPVPWNHHVGLKIFHPMHESLRE